jgi:CRP-like cAMP-binding protein
MRDLQPETYTTVLCELEQRTVMPPNETNLLLKSLSAESRELILSRSKPVHLPLRTPIYRQDEPAFYAYFLLSGVASIVATTDDGESVEVIMIGREGLVGSPELIGPGIAHTQCFVQSEATALRISLPDLRKAFLESEEIRSRVLEFLQVQVYSLSQIAACHRLHNAEERLARWLLMVRDRLQSNMLVLTQEFLGQMLGSRRSTVNLVAGTLQRGGLLEYSRGRVRILDSDGLESVACSCYQVIRDINRKLYSGPSQTAPGGLPSETVQTHGLRPDILSPEFDGRSK